MFPDRRPQRNYPIRPQQRPYNRQPMELRRSFQGQSIFGQRRSQQNLGQQRNSTPANLMGMFQTEEGDWDFDKMMSTVQQINGIYKQVSPMISTFIKK